MKRTGLAIFHLLAASGFQGPAQAALSALRLLARAGTLTAS